MLVLGCGFCADVEISGYLPFIPCLTVLFGVWCCLGLLLSRRARRCGKRLTVDPGRYLMATIIVFLLTAPLTMGSFLFPMLIILPLWLLSLFFRRPVATELTAELSAAESCAQDEAWVRRTVLGLSVLIVPLSYVVLLFVRD